MLASLFEMNHDFILNHNPLFQKPCELVHGFKSTFPLFIECSKNVIIIARNPFANFLNCFSFKLAKQLKVDLLNNFVKHANTLPNPSKMLHLSHSRKTLYLEHRICQ
jgi:hypothetical protein